MEDAGAQSDGYAAESRVFLVLTVVGIVAFLVLFSVTGWFFAQFASCLDELLPGEPLPALTAAFAYPWCQKCWRVLLLLGLAGLVLKEQVVRRTRVRFVVNCSAFVLLAVLAVAYLLALLWPAFRLMAPLREGLVPG